MSRMNVTLLVLAGNEINSNILKENWKILSVMVCVCVCDELILIYLWLSQLLAPLLDQSRCNTSQLNTTRWKVVFVNDKVNFLVIGENDNWTRESVSFQGETPRRRQTPPRRGLKFVCSHRISFIQACKDFLLVFGQRWTIGVCVCVWGHMVDEGSVIVPYSKNISKCENRALVQGFFTFFTLRSVFVRTHLVGSIQRTIH